MTGLRAQLLRQACGFRHGIVPPVDEVAAAFADLDGVYNACIFGDTGSTKESTAGGFARTRDGALSAAIAESLERYAASMARLPLKKGADLAPAQRLDASAFALYAGEQQRVPGFAWPVVDPARAWYAPVYALDDNREVWVPEELVGLGSYHPPATVPSTSTGLAAHPDPLMALLRGAEELLERDAFTVTWLSSLGGRTLALPPSYGAPVAARGGEVYAFELTQAWNPHAVVAVAGFLPQRGLRRYSLGCACCADHAQALEKAYLEWLQGTVFAGYYRNEHPTLRFDHPSEVRDFQQHGVYYTLRPDEWARVPLVHKRTPPRSLPVAGASSPPAAQLASLRRALGKAGVRLFYRDLTLPDVADAGLKVVRVLSPELSLLHGDEQAPFLGGRTRDVRWRYPEIDPREVAFPNPLPHPLG